MTFSSLVEVLVKLFGLCGFSVFSTSEICQLLHMWPSQHRPPSDLSTYIVLCLNWIFFRQMNDKWKERRTFPGGTWQPYMHSQMMTWPHWISSFLGSLWDKIKPGSSELHHVSGPLRSDVQQARLRLVVMTSKWDAMRCRGSKAVIINFWGMLVALWVRACRKLTAF